MPKQKSLIENVPTSLRKRSENPGAIATYIAAALGVDPSVSPEQAVSFINGYLAQQEVLRPENTMTKDKHPDKIKLNAGWAFFPATIKSVEIVERKYGPKKDKYLGKKARIVFKEKKQDKKGNVSKDNDFIETSWVEYAFKNRTAEMSWEMALARTIRDFAQDHIGEKVFICKHVFAAGDEAARNAIDIAASYDSEASSQAADDDDFDDSDDVSFEDELTQAGETLDIDSDEFDDETWDAMVAVLESEPADEDAVDKKFAKEMGMKVKELPEVEDDFDSIAEYLYLLAYATL